MHSLFVNNVKAVAHTPQSPIILATQRSLFLMQNWGA